MKNLRHYLRRNTKERIFNKTVEGSPAGEKQAEWESGGKGERGGREREEIEKKRGEGEEGGRGGMERERDGDRKRGEMEGTRTRKLNFTGIVV